VEETPCALLARTLSESHGHSRFTLHDLLACELLVFGTTTSTIATIASSICLFGTMSQVLNFDLKVGLGVRHDMGDTCIVTEYFVSAVGQGNVFQAAELVLCLRMPPGRMEMVR
jgi:hypothetical protein